MALRPVQSADDPLPEVPSLDVQEHATALLRAYGSSAVHERYEACVAAWHAVVGLHNIIRAAQRDQREGLEPGIQIWPMIQQLHDELWPALRDRYDELAAEIHQELGRPPQAPPWWRRLPRLWVLFG